MGAPAPATAMSRFFIVLPTTPATESGLFNHLLAVLQRGVGNEVCVVSKRAGKAGHEMAMPVDRSKDGLSVQAAPRSVIIVKILI